MDWMLIEGVGVEIRTEFQKAVQSVKWTETKHCIC